MGRRHDSEAEEGTYRRNFGYMFGYTGQYKGPDFRSAGPYSCVNWGGHDRARTCDLTDVNRAL
jgi:hypothetical protein